MRKQYKFLSTMLAALMLGGSCSAQVLFRNGKEIPLKLSQRYAALRLKPGISPSSAALTGAVEASANARIISNSPVLKNEGLILVAAKSPTGPAISRPQFTSSSSDLGQVVPVYELGGVDVILTNEVLLKPKSPVQRVTIDRLRTLGTLSPLSHGSYSLKVPTNVSSLEIGNELARSAEIEYAEPNFVTIVQPQPKVVATVPPKPGLGSSAATFPSDIYYSQQWSLENLGTGGKKKGADIRVRKAWDKADGNAIIIAVLDEGVDITHPDLKDKIVDAYDAISGQANQQPNAWDGHGTACAGIVAATTNNAAGIAGVGYKARIMPIRIASKVSADGDWVTTTEIIARGIDWAISHKADVLSNSWGGGDPDPYIEDAIKNGLANGRGGRGAVFVFAAGNHGTSVEWPASLAKSLPVIAVSATNEYDEFKTFNSRDGEDWWASNYGDEITVSAPGVHIITTDISGDGGYVKGDYFLGFNGTSAATPHVAGVAALILSIPANSRLKPLDVKELLQKTADPLGPTQQFGAGRVNACKAVSGSGC